MVKVKLSEITSIFQRFADAQDAYNAALVEESQRQESDVYFAEIETSLNFFCGTVNDSVIGYVLWKPHFTITR